MLTKDTIQANDRERPFKPDRQVASLTADLQQAVAQNTTGKGLFEVFKSALLLQKTACQQRILRYVKEREQLVDEKAAIDAECQ